MNDAVTLGEVAGQVADLRDLFQRRLLEDKAKNRLYDELYAQVEFARNGMSRSQLRPLFGELLLIIDRLRAESDNPVVASVVEELEEVLGRRDVRRMPELDTFDPQFHTAVKTEASVDAPKGTVLTVLRNGYLVGGEVLRPASVVVSQGSGDQLTTGSDD